MGLKSPPNHRICGKWICRFVLWAVLLAFTCAPLHAEEIEVPVAVQFPLFLKILSFDRNLKQRARGEVVLAVVYQSDSRPSLRVKEELEQALKRSPFKTVEEMPLRLVPIDLSNEDINLARVCSRSGVNVLYVAPLRGVALGGITGLSRAQRILTLTGIPEYVQRGISVGVGAKREKPTILINLPAAKAEGADFDSRLLKLAEVLR
jgi:hypothetical protein